MEEWKPPFCGLLAACTATRPWDGEARKSMGLPEPCGVAASRAPTPSRRHAERNRERTIIRTVPVHHLQLYQRYGTQNTVTCHISYVIIYSPSTPLQVKLHVVLTFDSRLDSRLSSGDWCLNGKRKTKVETCTNHNHNPHTTK